MNTSSHDFVTVDMRGLKAALVAQAREKGVSVSVVVRAAVARTLDVAEPEIPLDASGSEGSSAGSETVKLSIRFSRVEAARLDSGAKEAGMSRGAYLAGLNATEGALPGGPNRADQLAALVASNADLSSLSRDIRHLTALLAHGAVRTAQEYRQTLDTLAGDVHQHLRLASTVLGDLRPPRGGAGVSRRSQRAKKEKV
jgi:hypothetical protein